MLRNRLITAALLGALFLGALFLLPDLLWAIFLLVFIVIAAWEWGGLAGFGSTSRMVYPLLTLLAGLLLMPGDSALEHARQAVCSFLTVAATLFWTLLAPVWLLRRWRLGSGWVSALTGWLVLLPPWIALVNLRHIGPGVVLALMATVWIADSAAYFSGKRFGRHKLAPEISPGKTWEGLWGALASVALLSAVLCALFGWSYWFVAGLLAITVLSVIGDLFESLIKRQAGKKDSSSLLPGHGGVLDRIDGLTSTLPLAAFYVYFPFYLSLLSNP